MFVTGKWEDGEDAETQLAADMDDSDDEEIYGDFEDLETGEKHSAADKEGEGEGMQADFFLAADTPLFFRLFVFALPLLVLPKSRFLETGDKHPAEDKEEGEGEGV